MSNRWNLRILPGVIPVVLVLALLLTGCQPNYTIVTVTADAVSVQPTPELPTEEPPPTATLVPPTEVPPTEVPTEVPTEAPVEDSTLPPAEEITTPTPQPVAALPMERGELFATSGQCAVCHTMNTDAAGNDVAFDSQWRSSMMANSGRDPYWQAGVRNEVLQNPGYADFIEDKCTTCHMPMARFTRYTHEEQGILLDEAGFANPEHDLHILAMDGISCTLCHQIEPDNFGMEESFSGQYAIDMDTPEGERLAYGRFEVSETNAIVMQGSSGYIPVQADHVQESELCGTCHTLYTPTIDYEGEIAGEFAEQMVYPEWLNSAYSETDSCQDCHMPAADSPVALSITSPQDLRDPYTQHIFVGANFYMPDLLHRYPELGMMASRDHVDATIAQVMDQLQNETAMLSVDALALDGSTLTADVTVTSLVGHKFPTSYPARRTWLHVTVTDAAGAVVFESGAFTPEGAIVGNDNDADGTLYEPHYTVISSPDEVQIYEAIMSDVNGAPTTTLLLGAGYLKDNRLLPDGFDKANAHEDFQVWGAAETDADFIGGSDRLQYVIDTGEAQGPFTVTVDMLYQSIAYRWAHNLAEHDSLETNRFLAYYIDMPSPAGFVTSTTATTE
jgi:cytochrome c553